MAIRNNPDIVEGKGDELLRLKGEFDQLVSDMDTAIKAALDEMEGAAADSYLEQWNDMLNPTLKDSVPNYLETNGNNLRQIAINYRELDNEMSQKLRM